ncbi:MAG: methyltransferase domain-containing protein [Armatimonadota bacterium]
MKSVEFAKMRALQDAHWWFDGRRYLLRSLVRKLALRNSLILDAGCGTSFAHCELQEAGTVISLDNSPQAFIDRENNLLACLARFEQSPFPDETFDLIVALDLLEHLDDDHQALVEAYRVCRTGGYLFVTVPAYQWAWSHHDEVLGHCRRYSAHTLGYAVQKAGFVICQSSYFVSSVFVPALVYRIIRQRFAKAEDASDLGPVPAPLNHLLRLCMRIEAHLALGIGLPFGLTVCLLAQKRS